MIGTDISELLQIIEENNTISFENEAIKLEIEKINNEKAIVNDQIDNFAKNKTKMSRIKKQLQRQPLRLNRAMTFAPNKGNNMPK